MSNSAPPPDPELERQWFASICTSDEVDRILNPKTCKDYLLKLRAETIADHARFYRVYRSKALSKGTAWSLEGSFSDSHYSAFLRQLSIENKEILQTVTYGDTFSDEPNGSAFPTKYGNIVTIDESLKYFMFFAQLAILQFSIEIPTHVRLNSLRIACRTMLKTESMDFYLDPRGIIPDEVSDIINKTLDYQLRFIAGHEFAHCILGHLSTSDLVERPILRARHDEEDYKPTLFYNKSQQDEFDADLQAILLPQYGDDEREQILIATLIWFACLELFEHANEIISPRSSFSYRTHPPTQDRYERLLSEIPFRSESQTQHFKDFHRGLDSIKSILENDISLNYDAYDFYGSVYLDAPNTEWRGPELIDRRDF